MIFGLGTDLVQQSRIADSEARFGERFIRRILTEREYSQWGARPRDAGQRTRFLAQRFAAKEAFSKALGTGIRQGVGWRDMGVHNEPSGKPCLHVSPAMQSRLESLGIQSMHVSLSDEAGVTVAVVILETH